MSMRFIMSITTFLLRKFFCLTTLLNVFLSSLKHVALVLTLIFAVRLVLYNIEISPNISPSMIVFM